MAYIVTNDEKQSGYYSSNSTDYSDAPANMNSSFTLAEGLYNAAHGLLGNYGNSADTDVYSMGNLFAGSYSVKASVGFWFYGTGYASYITPQVAIYNSKGVLVSGSGYLSNATFTITSPDTYYVAVTGVTYQASQYDLIAGIKATQAEIISTGLFLTGFTLICWFIFQHKKNFIKR